MNSSHLAQFATPHSGYHWDGSDRRYFEGWYFRITLPDSAQSIAFMYSIEDPNGGQPYSGGCAQILGPNEEYLCRTFPHVDRFWAWRDMLGLGHWGKTGPALPARYLLPEEFTQQVPEGYQATIALHQGCLHDPGSGRLATWHYTTQPIDGWGDRHQPPRSTAGWFSQFQIFEPGWQVLMAHGFATGHFIWNGTRYDFTNAPAYAEKNWGGAFPQKWFWIQCNAFEQEPDLTVSSAGGIRKVLGWSQTVGMVGIHYQGKFYEFGSTHCPLKWLIHPWGYWSIQAETADYSVELTGTCDRPPANVRIPSEQGMIFDCRDTTSGKLTLTLRDMQRDRTIVMATSSFAGLETGGSPWNTPWSYS